jgi:hypothetical protein
LKASKHVVLPGQICVAVSQAGAWSTPLQLKPQVIVSGMSPGNAMS